MTSVGPMASEEETGPLPVFSPSLVINNRIGYLLISLLRKREKSRMIIIASESLTHESSETALI